MVVKEGKGFKVCWWGGSCKRLEINWSCPSTIKIANAMCTRVMGGGCCVGAVRNFGMMRIRVEERRPMLFIVFVCSRITCT